jgi:hypothetical protein
VSFFRLGLCSPRPSQQGIQPQGLDNPEIFLGTRKLGSKNLVPLQQLVD